MSVHCAIVGVGDYQDGRKAYNRGDYATALKQLLPLAEQGHAGAQYFVGYMYYKGQGVVQNGTEAVKWLRKAAEQGDVKAQLRLGMMFRLGSSVAKNYAEAEKWLRKATEQGDAKARYNLGLMYYRGEGVDQDDIEGLKLIRIQRRDGSRHSDFGFIWKKYVEPAGDKQFTKPIIVLTDRKVVSSGEYFVMAMKQFPYVRTVGDTTFGALGSPIRKKLPNGWEYRIPTGKWCSADNILYEDIGVPPDIHVAVSPSDSLMERDPVIEMAIQLLK